MPCGPCAAAPAWSGALSPLGSAAALCWWLAYQAITASSFTAALSPANEVPPVTNAESGVSGTANITFVTTKDAAGNITSATVTFAVTLGGFPAGSAINIAHIHEGPSTCVCPVVVNTTLGPGDVTVANGLTSFTKTVSAAADVTQRILANPSGFYFNVHSTLNPGGVARGTLVKLG